MPLKKNDEIRLKIDSVSSLGSGVGHYGEMAVFVSNTAAGDDIIAHIIKVKKTYAVAKIKKILSPSKD
ncbi:MAG: TRAM domain-containing protein, partial [Acutalibacteraceae bacterium]